MLYTSLPSLLSVHCSDVIPKVWVERVNGIIPGIGYHVRSVKQVGSYTEVTM